MNHQLYRSLLITVVLLTCQMHGASAVAEEWKIPLAGNAYRTDPGPGDLRIDRQTQTLALKDVRETYSVYFHCNTAAKLSILLEASATESNELEVQIADQPKMNVQVAGEQLHELQLGELATAQSGYLRLQLRKSGSGNAAILVKNVVVRSDDPTVKLDYVRNNDGNMFYWGRRGPSVHLSYNVPKTLNLSWAYSELTVPEGQDPIGTYYMANGFGEGYFGMQVNSESERRVLFSVWSPFQTDNPREIPESKRIVLVAKGEQTKVGEFGNEGSGGQSYMLYPWKAGQTYRFLTQVKPVDNNSTEYTCWFAAKTQPWQLVASFRRPETSTHLRGFHSFLESFDPSRGHMGRECLYGNIWVADTEGNWQVCDSARFTVDATGGGRHRLDFEGGSRGDDFFLHNCGFFSGAVAAGTSVKRQSSQDQLPEVDFDKLPR